jgi:uncharacterized protein (TIGR02246 family)
MGVFVTMSSVQDEQEIRELVFTFIAGWNTADGALLASAFAEDADFIAVTGQHGKGREIIGKVHDEILSTVFKGTRNTATVNEIRFLRPDVASVDVTFRIASMPDKPWIPPYSTCGIVATKDDGAWSIAVLRNMIPFERPTGGQLDGEHMQAAKAAMKIGAR